jgi:hypothetical protein
LILIWVPQDSSRGISLVVRRDIWFTRKKKEGARKIEKKGDFCFWNVCFGFDRLLRRQLQHLHQGLQRLRKTLQYLEVLCILFLRFKLMYQCCWVELCLLISYSLQTNLIFGDWWECGPFGCSVSCLNEQVLVC